MKNSFVIRWDSGRSEHFICSCCVMRVPIGSTIAIGLCIPTFYSYLHAMENGWRHTKDIRYCPPEEKLGVWVCPDCFENAANPVPCGAVMPVPPNYQWACLFDPSMPNGWAWCLGLVEQAADTPNGKKIGDIRAYVERSKNGKWGWVVYAPRSPAQRG